MQSVQAEPICSIPAGNEVSVLSELCIQERGLRQPNSGRCAAIRGADMEVPALPSVGAATRCIRLGDNLGSSSL
ncbi:hypothetical protein NDU88_006369 [Pleurodeles waltl]|uniref:Uncharacterized protein n=1 Tax=Pleurodeles waltl TaxID=8319 RepID=A0AAV7SPC1_PLEWA|nr:hypothetical protein NDU88_006369 [Pleurodeles waltl]